MSREQLLEHLRALPEAELARIGSLVGAELGWSEPSTMRHESPPRSPPPEEVYFDDEEIQMERIRR